MAQLEPYEMVLPPREAAAQLGVAPSTLRRLATVYVDVYGPDALGWSDGGKGGGSRLWTGSALRRTRAARELVESGRASSFELALRTLKDTPEDQLALVTVSAESGLEVAELRAEVSALRDALEGLSREVATLQALPPSAEPERVGESSQTPEPEGQAEAEHPPETPADGLIVRAARWLERKLRR